MPAVRRHPATDDKPRARCRKPPAQCLRQANFILRGAGWRPSPSCDLQLFRVVSRLDAREHRGAAVASRDVQASASAASPRFHMLGVGDARYAQIDLAEVVDGDGLGNRAIACCWCSAWRVSECDSVLGSGFPGWQRSWLRSVWGRGGHKMFVIDNVLNRYKFEHRSIAEGDN